MAAASSRSLRPIETATTATTTSGRRSARSPTFRRRLSTPQILWWAANGKLLLGNLNLLVMTLGWNQGCFKVYAHHEIFHCGNPLLQKYHFGTFDQLLKISQIQSEIWPPPIKYPPPLPLPSGFFHFWDWCENVKAKINQIFWHLSFSCWQNI